VNDWAEPLFLPLREDRVAYRVLGNGPPLLMIHGWPFHGATYRHLAKRLSQHRTCFVTDSLGLGDSRWSERTDFSFAGQAVTFRRFVDALGFKKYSIVAHDTGATIARLLAAEDRRIETLVMLNTEMPGHRPPWIPFYCTVMRFGLSRHVVPLLLRSRALMRSPAGFGGCFHDEALLDEGFVGRYLQPLIDDPRRVQGSIRYLRGLDWALVDGLADVHRMIRARVRFVYGGEDPTFPVAEARRCLGQFRDAHLTTIDRARLLVQEERPDEVADAVMTALSE
jgi:pimeloyl-ACP methyl ester carboxylesterase